MVCSRHLDFFVYLFAINFNISNVVLKHSRDVDLRELILTEDDKQTSLPACTISNYHQLLPDCSHLQTKTQVDIYMLRLDTVNSRKQFKQGQKEEDCINRVSKGGKKRGDYSSLF